jgi:hypothetical protein
MRKSPKIYISDLVHLCCKFVSSHLCFELYLIYMNHLWCEETYKIPMQMYQINLTDLN